MYYKVFEFVRWFVGEFKEVGWCFWVDPVRKGSNSITEHLNLSRRFEESTKFGALIDKEAIVPHTSWDLRVSILLRFALWPSFLFLVFFRLILSWSLHHLMWSTEEYHSLAANASSQQHQGLIVIVRWVLVCQGLCLPFLF